MHRHGDEQHDRPDDEERERNAIELEPGIAGEAERHRRRQQRGEYRPRAFADSPFRDQEPSEDADGRQNTRELPEKEYEAKQEADGDQAGQPSLCAARQERSDRDDQKQRVPVGGRIEELHECERRHREAAHDRIGADEWSQHDKCERRLDDREHGEGIAHADEVAPE